MLTLSRNHSLRVCVAWTTCLIMLLPPAAIAEDGLFGLFGGYTEGTPVEQLARQIDKLEKHIDQNGSIVIKTPDVWGESRLMRHRSDVETQLKARLGAFDFRINAVQATRDAAFLATAVALQEQIAATGNVAALGPVPTTPPAGSPTPQAVNNAVAGLIGDPNILGTTTTPSFIPRSAFAPAAVVAGTQNRALTVNIEPVIELDQLNRYLQHLNELRRLNEGDDNSDTPGYALNLIRIPVSVLPGRRTEQGFGAEVQITIDPYMSDEILPMAFKDFVIKGLVDRIGFDVFQIAQRADIVRLDKDLNANPTPKPANKPKNPALAPAPAAPIPAPLLDEESDDLNVEPEEVVQPQSAETPPSDDDNENSPQWRKFKKEEFYNSLQSGPLIC